MTITFALESNAALRGDQLNRKDLLSNRTALRDSAKAFDQRLDST